MLLREPGDSNYFFECIGVILGGDFLEDNDSNARRGVLTWGGGGVGRDYLLLIINICAVKNVTTGGSPKICYEGQAQKCPPPHAKRDPPPHT